jgi:hypothetical protein
MAVAERIDLPILTFDSTTSPPLARGVASGSS